MLGGGATNSGRATVNFQLFRATLLLAMIVIAIAGFMGDTQILAIGLLLLMITMRL